MTIHDDNARPNYSKVIIAISAAFGSAVISVFIAWISRPVDARGVAAPLNLGEIYLNALLGFATVELLIILVQNVKLEHIFHVQGRNLERTALHNTVQNNLTQTLLRVFDHAGGPAHVAVAHSISRFLDTIDINEKSLTLQTDYLAREMYQNFWEELLNAQRRRKEGQPGLTAFMTHSAPAYLWSSNSFSRSRQQQEEFIALGGSVFRIFIKTANNDEEDRSYAEQIKLMHDKHVHAFYLDGEASEVRGVHDYMLVAFDNQYFSLAWNPKWGIPEDGVLSACEVKIGRDSFVADFWPRWLDLVERLERRPVNMSQVLNSLPAPTPEEVKAMKTLP